MTTATLSPPLALHETRNAKAHKCSQCRERYEYDRASSKYCSVRCRVAALRKRRKRSVHGRSGSYEYSTPQWFFDKMDARYGFELDVCATDENAKCDRYYTMADDGLSQPWRGVCWCNPPYGNEIPAWLTKAYASAQEGATVVCLVPARPGSAWWHDIVLRHASSVECLRRRLKFGGMKTPAPFPSAVVVFFGKRGADMSEPRSDELYTGALATCITALD